MWLRVIVSVSMVMLMSVAWAEKPEWAGKGKPSAEQKEAHKAAMKAKRSEQELEGGDDSEEDDKPEKAKKEKMKKRKDKIDAERRAKPGLTERGEDVSDEAERERKETGKGSDQGQQSRQEHSRKWWQFWKEE